jgi:hypothetical protein
MIITENLHSLPLTILGFHKNVHNLENVQVIQLIRLITFT